MFHAKTPVHNKEVILKSMQDKNGVVRIIFCTVTLGMGVHFANLNCIIHYGVPRSIKGYCQEYGLAGHVGDPAKCVKHWASVKAPLGQPK